MKIRFSTCVFAVTLFAAPNLRVSLMAQDTSKPTHHRYKLIDLGTFGGITSYINPVGNGGPYMNREGMVVGSSMTFIPIPANQNGYPCPSPPNQVFHAMKWSRGDVVDLKSLEDASNCGNALAINDHGESVGTSENGRLDPITSALQIRAVLWKDGQIENLGTFGGNHSFASAISNRGQIVGFALNDIPDPYSLFEFGIGGITSGTQTRAFLWHDGHKKDLGTLGGPDAWATFVNERGQVAGYSYTNSTPNPTTGVPTQDPFLWSKDGGMFDLGTLGGTFGFPTGLNNRGEVIGLSKLAGDQNADPFLWDGKELIDMFTAGTGGNFVDVQSIDDAGQVVGAASFPNRPFDAAIWKDRAVTDLGALPGDCFSWAFVLNSKGQAAGSSYSCPNGNTGRAVLWEDNKVFDLNTLIPPDSSLFLVESNAINDRGEIAGNGFPPGCADFSCTHAYVLIPCDGNSSDEDGCEDVAKNITAATENGPASLSQTSAEALNGRLTPREIANRIRARFGRRRLRTAHEQQ